MILQSTNLFLFPFVLFSYVFVTEAFLGFTKLNSLIFYEPPVSNIGQRENEVTEHFFTQRLDNFDSQNLRTFQMVIL